MILASCHFERSEKSFFMLMVYQEGLSLRSRSFLKNYKTTFWRHSERSEGIPWITLLSMLEIASSRHWWRGNPLPTHFLNSFSGRSLSYRLPSFSDIQTSDNSLLSESCSSPWSTCCLIFLLNLLFASLLSFFSESALVIPLTGFFFLERLMANYTLLIAIYPNSLSATIRNSIKTLMSTTRSSKSGGRESCSHSRYFIKMDTRWFLSVVGCEVKKRWSSLVMISRVMRVWSGTWKDFKIV